MGLIKKYETGELIGTGSMGSVYRARDIVLEREVALKILHSRGDLDPELKERFYREARTGANLRHPNVVIVYELDEYNGVPFMAMELLSGVDGRRYIAERRPMSLAQKVELFAQICDGLSEAHRRGIVHRDIKPSNIFIQDDGTAKILDFGIARVSSSKLTVAGKVLGTPNYMAPEQINRRQCDSRSDLFSAAIVFFEFLVYSHPFQCAFIPRRIVEDDPDTLFDRDPLIPQSLADLLYRALQKRPESRIQAAEEFAAALRGVLQELRTGLATESIIHSTNPVPLPDPTPSSMGSPDSPDGRLAGFVQLMSDFDTAARIKDVASARAIIAEMARVEAIDQRFSDALLDCRKKLEQLQNAAAPATEHAAPPMARAATAATVGAGGLHPAPAIDDPFTKRGTNGPAYVPRTERAWGSDQNVFDDRAGKGAADAPRPWEADALEELNLVCVGCGARNREAASYCQSCGMPLELPRTEQAAHPPGSHTKPISAGSFGDRLAAFGNAFSREAGRSAEWISDGSRRVWTMISGLPRRTWYVIVGTAAVFAITAIALLYTFGPLRPIPIQNALGTATVQSVEIPLLESETPSSKRLEFVPRGTRLNILSRVTSPDQRLVRVQLVARNKGRQPGFVAVAGLGEWTSSDPAVAWEYLALNRSQANASSESVRLYSQSLVSFFEKFPGTPQARLAAVEQAQIHLDLAERSKTAGKDRAQWQSDLDAANRALITAGVSESGGEDDKRLLTRVQDLTKEDEPVNAVEPTPSGAGPQSMTANVEVAKQLRIAQEAWWAGEYERCDAAANKALEIAPRNSKSYADALWWLDKSRESKKRISQ